MNHNSRFGPGGVHTVRVQTPPFGLNDHPDIETELAGKVKVALVMSGDGHDRAGAVLGQHEIAQPDRNAIAGKRMEAISSGEHAVLFQRVGLPIQAIHVARLVDERPNFRLIGLPGDQRFNQGMFGGQGHEGHSEHGIGPGGKYPDLTFTPLQGKDDFRPHGLAYPIALHGQHALGQPPSSRFKSSNNSSA